MHGQCCKRINLWLFSFLDHMAMQWDGLVLNDYEAVMPLPWKKKFGIAYLYQPFLTAQLGVFGKDLSATLLQKFLDHIPEKFKLWEFSLNHGNHFAVERYKLYDRVNFVLPLNNSYETICSHYRENTKRNVRKTENYHLTIHAAEDVREVIALSKKQNSAESDDNYARFLTLYEVLKQQDRTNCYGVRSQKGELVASAVFIFSNHRAYYILVGNHPNGRTLGASHALVDAFIRDHAQQNLLLDFEGSDLRQLAFFYSGFGAREEKYTAIRRNHLPWYVKWLK
ncbi:MAG: GNAT family N-acetyltransferase [Flavisolibacter sp.]